MLHSDPPLHSHWVKHAGKTADHAGARARNRNIVCRSFIYQMIELCWGKAGQWESGQYSRAVHRSPGSLEGLMWYEKRA